MSTIGWDELGFITHASKTMKDTPVLYDVGMNRGDFTEEFLKLCPTAMVYGFEPITEIYNQTNEKFKHNKNVKIFNYGLSDENRDNVNFYYLQNGYDGMSSIHYRPKYYPQYNVKEIFVKLKTLDSIYEHLLEPDYIKLDVEGHELYLLYGADSMIDSIHPKYIQLEVGECLIDSGATFKQLVDFLYSKNYIIYNQNFAIINPQNVTEDYDVKNYLAEYKGEI